MERLFAETKPTPTLVGLPWETGAVDLDTPPPDDELEGVLARLLPLLDNPPESGAAWARGLLEMTVALHPLRMGWAFCYDLATWERLATAFDADLREDDTPEQLPCGCRYDAMAGIAHGAVTGGRARQMPSPAAVTTCAFSAVSFIVIGAKAIGMAPMLAGLDLLPPDVTERMFIEEQSRW